jgi:esterase/lipase superfamily enzyme
MSIYLISNRKVRNGRFSNKGKDRAQRSFRVATVHDYESPDTIDYTILPDNNEFDYAHVLRRMDRDGHINIKNLGGTAYMFADLYQQMLAVGDGQSDTLFFIHGFANDLESNLEHIHKLYNLYIKPADSGIDHLVFVSWPSIGHKLLTYWNDQEDAEDTGEFLGALFRKLFRFFTDLFERNGSERCSNKIHLMAHSMGNTVLEHMLRNIPDQKLFPLFGEAFSLHADAPHDVYEEGGAFRRLNKIADRTHIYISRSDDVLAYISRYTKNFKARLGHKGPRDRSKLDSETFIVDTTNAGRASTAKERYLDHWGYIEREIVVKDILHVLSGMDEDDIPTREKWDEEKQYFYIKKDS